MKRLQHWIANLNGMSLNWQATERMPKIAWKTGTSYGKRDAWSIGYNKNYTVGVWVGNFSGVSAPDLSGANTATPLLFKIFNTIDYDSDEEWFTQPEDCGTRLVCSETGLLPADHCTNKVMDYFIPLISPMVICNNVQEIMLSADERRQDRPGEGERFGAGKSSLQPVSSDGMSRRRRVDRVEEQVDIGQDHFRISSLRMVSSSSSAASSCSARSRSMFGRTPIW